jgi:hypothetical protein
MEEDTVNDLPNPPKEAENENENDWGANWISKRRVISFLVGEKGAQPSANGSLLLLPPNRARARARYRYSVVAG